MTGQTVITDETREAEVDKQEKEATLFVLDVLSLELPLHPAITLWGGFVFLPLIIWMWIYCIFYSHMNLLQYMVSVLFL